MILKSFIVISANFSTTSALGEIYLAPFFDGMGTPSKGVWVFGKDDQGLKNFYHTKMPHWPLSAPINGTGSFNRLAPEPPRCNACFDICLGRHDSLIFAVHGGTSRSLSQSSLRVLEWHQSDMGSQSPYYMQARDRRVRRRCGYLLNTFYEQDQPSRDPAQRAPFGKLQSHKMRPFPFNYLSLLAVGYAKFHPIVDRVVVVVVQLQLL